MDEKVLIAICDIGSNSVRMNIIELDKLSGKTKIKDSYRSMLGLAGYIKDDYLTNDGRGKLLTVLREYLFKANSTLCDTFTVFATEALRKVSNSKDVLDYIKKNLGIEIIILSGEDEAKYDNIAVNDEWKDKLKLPYYVLDMGGGSVELNLNEKDNISYSSIPLGSLVISKRFAKNPMDVHSIDYESIEKYVLNILKENSPNVIQNRNMYVIGGTARAAGRICTGERGESISKKKTNKYTCDELDNIVSMMIRDNNYTNEIVEKYCPDRKQSIVCGLFALNLIMKYYKPKKIIVCKNGVREGYLLHIKNDL